MERLFPIISNLQTHYHFKRELPSNRNPKRVDQNKLFSFEMVQYTNMNRITESS